MTEAQLQGVATEMEKLYTTLMGHRRSGTATMDMVNAEIELNP